MCCCVFYLWGWTLVDFALAILRVGCIHRSLSNVWRRIYFVAFWSNDLLAGLVAIVPTPLWFSMVLYRCLIPPSHIGTDRVRASFSWSFALCRLRSLFDILRHVLVFYNREANHFSAWVKTSSFLLRQGMPLLPLLWPIFDDCIHVQPDYRRDMAYFSPLLHCTAQHFVGCFREVRHSEVFPYPLRQSFSVGVSCWLFKSLRIRFRPYMLHMVFVRCALYSWHCIKYQGDFDQSVLDYFL